MRYIGQRRFSKSGWKTYLGSGRRIVRAIRKYGRENFRRDVLYIAFDADSLNAAEIAIIAEFNAANDPGFYNISHGGNSGTHQVGRKHTPETRAKISAANMGHPVSEVARKVVAENARRSHAKGVATRRARKSHEGETHFRSQSVTINGMRYTTISAARKAGYRWDSIKAVLTGSDLPERPKWPAGSKDVWIDGEHYRSIKAAMDATGRSREAIRKHIASQKPA